MQIVINGEARDLTNRCTVATLLQDMGLAEKRIAVEVNQEIVPRSQHGAYELQHNDHVEVVQAIGGG